MNNLLWKTEKQIERIEKLLKEVKEEITQKNETRLSFLIRSLHSLRSIQTDLLQVRNILQPLNEEFTNILHQWNLHKKGKQK
jgi:sialic acid synthase SpsE